MQLEGDYGRDGFALVRGLVPAAVCNALLRQIEGDVVSKVPAGQLMRQPNLLKREAVELYGFHYPPLLGFLWGLTPTVSTLLGLDLLPSYSYFRIYREGDVCRVHCDRYACEVSLSLTLDYSDGVPWPLEMAKTAVPPSALVEEDFGTLPFAAVEMEPGDGVLYQGVERRHGRITPNPNGWSAHLFCHWVRRDGPHAAYAFDGRAEAAQPVNFRVG
jgi:hypothetical protein